MLFLSGTAALIYQVVWARHLCLIFGGSHLAVTTVLAVFMGGLAIGSYWFGRKAPEKSRLFRLYAVIEFGIAISAVLFWVLMKCYPTIYVFFAQINNSSIVYLTTVRIVLALIALIVPTTLMGGTLPILSNLVSNRDSFLGVGVSLLYAVNTLGAVVGAALAGFILIPLYSVSGALVVAVASNIAVGTLCIVLDIMALSALRGTTTTSPHCSASYADHDKKDGNIASPSSPMSQTLVLWGIGISGFCAMGYEILWTRILSIIAGASVYAFTLMLMAFLSGISIGSSSFVLLSNRLFRSLASSPKRLIIVFGAVQIVIGISAYFVSSHLYEMSSLTNLLYFLLHDKLHLAGSFETRQTANFILVFAFMLVPAFFMGFTFPLTVAIFTNKDRPLSCTVGKILSSNTVGAIIGSATCGYFLIYSVGLQSSLQVLILANIGIGLIALASILRNSFAYYVTAIIVLLSFSLPFFFPQALRLWTPKISAIYQRGDDTHSDRFQDTMANFEILYHGEGIQELVSSIHNYGELFFITNGRIEASNDIKDMKLQMMLGHLPMLLNRNPRKVFVLGTGTGMTLGAVSSHPEIEQITLAEIEPKMINIARTFGGYNHQVLDNPKLRLAFNDGRNYLMTSKERFDVITADPVHPWFSGTGYLYSREYFKLVAEHLNSGGIACQWLPLYELSEENIKSVIKTFSETFRFSMLWYAQEDAILIGSNSPILIDEGTLERRIHIQQVHDDLVPLRMGSAEQFLSSFVMGKAGISSYSFGGIINTDDNLYLEFSAPRSIGNYDLIATNITGLARHRESILPYLNKPADIKLQTQQQQRWATNNKAADLNDRAHVLQLQDKMGEPEFTAIVDELDKHYTDYAPWKFFSNTTPIDKLPQQQQLATTTMKLRDLHGHTVTVNLAAHYSISAPDKACLLITDTTTQFIYGKYRFTGQPIKSQALKIAQTIMIGIEELYKTEQQKALQKGLPAPQMSTVLPEVRNLVAQKLAFL
jgi:spermidine synthase